MHTTAIEKLFTPPSTPPAKLESCGMLVLMDEGVVNLLRNLVGWSRLESLSFRAPDEGGAFLRFGGAFLSFGGTFLSFGGTLLVFTSQVVCRLPRARVSPHQIF
jgi:hypothetical protein